MEETKLLIQQISPYGARYILKKLKLLIFNRKFREIKMARASLILAGLLGILGVAAISGGFLFGNFVTTSITEGIEDALVILRDEDDYADWLTNEDDGDIPRYKTYYFWNLTNAAAYLTGADPVMKEIGPYVFRQFDRKIQVEFNADNTEVTYLTYTYYVFEAGLSADGASVEDRIININTAYLGAIAGAGSEAALVIGFVGPVVAGIVDGLVTTFSEGVIVQGESLAITTILAGLQGDFTDGVQVTGAATALATIAEGLTENFVSGVLTQALAIGLEDIQAGVTEELEFAVNSTVSANLIAGNWAALQGATDTTTANFIFFNDASAQGDFGLTINGVAGYLTSNTLDLTYTNDSITAFLHEGAPSLGVQGWLEDLDTGMGILGYLIAYEKAITNDGLNNATMMLMYNATQAQLDGAAAYLTMYLIDSNAVVAGAHLVDKGISTQAAAELLFYDQWANSTSVPGGVDLIDDMIDAPSGFEVGSDFLGGAPTASNISRNTTLRLFDSSNGLALSNVTGTATWLLAAAGNTTLQGLLTSAYLDLNLTQFGMIYAWIAGFYTNFITPATVANFSPLGVISTDDIGYLQFGNSFVTSGDSLLDLDPSLLLEAEFWAWSERVDSDDHTLNVTNSRGLLSGSMNLTDATGVGTFLALATGNNITGINTLFGTKLEITDLLNLTRYITYLIDSFVLAALPITAWDELAYFHWGNGAVTSGLSLF
ncbi:MAG: hypothetical protein IH840_09405, partial [Candidatus Heimdallarchaeota archaeon]|nr:hypothetical protein [Candidatus Heimdallarchaeota archaeon]